MAVPASPARRALGSRPISARPALARLQPAVVLLAALLCVLAYAVFADGATQLPQETYVQVALAAMAVVVCALLLTETKRLPGLPRLAWSGLGSLAGFAAWNGLSLLWTVAPEATWISFNRAIAYVTAAGLAVAVGAWVPRAVERLALGWLVIAGAAALYAVGGKLAPGAHIGGLFDLNQTEIFSRLRAPLGYWNALALVCALAAPVAIQLATDTARRSRIRLAGLGTLFLVVVVGGMTYSRGGVLALVVVVVTITILGSARLRGLLALAMALLAAVAPLAVAFTSSALTSDGISLSRRTHAGLILTAVMLVCLAALLAAGRWAIGLESRIAWNPRRSRAAWRALAVATAVLVLTGVVALSASARGLTGSIRHQVDTFTAVRKDPITDPSRLLSTSSGNRWVWWLEAVGAFSDRPVAGWGAGSFPVVHLLYRKPPPLPVRQPHSVPLQFLAEDGILGAGLALGGLLALTIAAFARIRALPAGRERDLGVALVAAALAWLVHGTVDWDWDIPGVTLPALCMLGVIAAARSSRAENRRRGVDGRRGEASSGASSGAAWTARPGSEQALRLGVLALVTLLFSAVAVSAILPAWSRSKALDALASITPGSSDRELQHAAAQEELAAHLDPLGDDPLLDAANIAVRRNRPRDERRYLLEAVSRDPYDAVAWYNLAGASLAAQDRDGAVRALRRGLQLDPLNPQLVIFSQLVQLVAFPPGTSATATGTPLGAATRAGPTPAARNGPVAPTPPHR